MFIFFSPGVLYVIHFRLQKFLIPYSWVNNSRGELRAAGNAELRGPNSLGLGTAECGSKKHQPPCSNEPPLSTTVELSTSHPTQSIIHQDLTMTANNEQFYLRYYSGHSGRFGHEFLGTSTSPPRPSSARNLLTCNDLCRIRFPCSRRWPQCNGTLRQQLELPQ